MSNYMSKAKNPKTGKIEDVSMLDDFYGKHEYGVQFKDGSTYREKDIDIFVGEV